jgi:1,2-diacylglycerol 3-alpha-glucosyltransferase
MNIVMFTNDYLPRVGGVSNSVARLAADCRRRGHQVYVVAPEFRNTPPHEQDVIRIPAIQNFNGSDFSVSLPAPLLLSEALTRFKPDIIHTHHQFLLGDTALRVSATHNLPLVLTYHTMYENYMNYVPPNSAHLKRFIVELASGFANLCDQVIAPSESIARQLKRQEITAPITVIPTGVNCDAYRTGDGTRIRQQTGIPTDAFVLGFVGRLAPEKNLRFLADAVAAFLQRNERGHFLVVGNGSASVTMRDIFREQGVQNRVHFVGTQHGADLIDYYRAMDGFVFASKIETQGMVLAEAMAAEVPVVALDAPGAREIVQDRINGRLLPTESVASMADALTELSTLPEAAYRAQQQAALQRAQQFSRETVVGKVLALYEHLLQAERQSREGEHDNWEKLRRAVKQEWELWSNRISAGVEALSEFHPF